MLDISNDIADTIYAAVCLGHDWQHILFYIVYVDVIFVNRNAQRFSINNMINIFLAKIYKLKVLQIQATIQFLQYYHLQLVKVLF